MVPEALAHHGQDGKRRARVKDGRDRAAVQVPAAVAQRADDGELEGGAADVAVVRVDGGGDEGEVLVDISVEVLGRLVRVWEMVNGM